MRSWNIPLLFIFFWPHRAACGILVPWKGRNGSRQWGPWALTTGPPENSQTFNCSFFFSRAGIFKSNVRGDKRSPKHVYSAWNGLKNELDLMWSLVGLNCSGDKGQSLSNSLRGWGRCLGKCPPTAWKPQPRLPFTVHVQSKRASKWGWEKQKRRDGRLSLNGNWSGCLSRLKSITRSQTSSAALDKLRTPQGPCIHDHMLSLVHRF